MGLSISRNSNYNNDDDDHNDNNNDDKNNKNNSHDRNNENNDINDSEKYMNSDHSICSIENLKWPRIKYYGGSNLFTFDVPI